MAIASTFPVRLPIRAIVMKFAIDMVVILLGIVPVAILAFVNWCYYLPRGGGSPIVSEWRVGKNGKFAFYKLRIKTRSGYRTAFGEWLRHWGIDESAQLLNFVKRDMTLIGPRPETPDEATRHVGLRPDYFLRLRVLPGLFGLGIGTVTNHMLMSGLHSGIDRLVHDLRYIREWSFALEMEAAQLSIRDILRGHDPTPA